MISSDFSDSSLQPLFDQLGARQRFERLNAKELRRRAKLPPDLGFGPNFGLATAKGWALIHILAESSIFEVPDWIKKAKEKISSHDNLSIILITTPNSGIEGLKLAKGIIESCQQLGLGLACETANGVQLVLPPNYVLKPGCESEFEHGHIPGWVLDSLEQGTNFSTHLQECLQAFIQAYRTSINGGTPPHKDESRLLYGLAGCIDQGDNRLFFPTNRIHVLQEYEASHANLGSRDHFFHTFNDYLLGLIILENMLDEQQERRVPDKFIRARRPNGRLKTWEALWALTCLFHDPGYLAEDPKSTFAFTLGMEYDPRIEQEEMQDPMRTQLIDAWETRFGESRRDLNELIKRVSASFVPGEAGREYAEQFDQVMKRAYFDGKRPGHSIISGLSLIQRCRTDKTTPHSDYDKTVALIACEIAALSMMFHDPKCRDKFIAGGIEAVSFEQLPYAATLMFVDAIQDDRRDISKGTFPKHGVLNSIEVDRDSNTVTATVCLRELPLVSWPWKIAEYESVLYWINAESDTKFSIDYRTQAELWIR